MAVAVAMAAGAGGCALPEERPISSKKRATRFPVSGGWDAPWVVVGRQGTRGEGGNAWGERAFWSRTARTINTFKLARVLREEEVGVMQQR